MFGAFKPSAPLSGGLLWKIPWRLSSPQKLRHRRRMRRVDNIVSVLDSALQRQAASAFSQQTQSQPPSELPNSPLPHQAGKSSKASPDELAQTAQGQRMLDAASHPDQEARRHGRGPRQGEMLPEQHAPSTAGSGAAANIRLQSPTRVKLGDVARDAGTIKLIERWKVEMPSEQEMLPKDKYTMFDRKAKGYRKGVHKLPKWTRLSQRLNPPGF